MELRDSWEAPGPKSELTESLAQCAASLSPWHGDSLQVHGAGAAAALSRGGTRGTDGSVLALSPGGAKPEPGSTQHMKTNPQSFSLALFTSIRPSGSKAQPGASSFPPRSSHSFTVNISETGARRAGQRESAGPARAELDSILSSPKLAKSCTFPRQAHGTY